MSDPYDTLGETYALNMQVSMQRKTIDAMQATKEHDEALLRQALEALERARNYDPTIARTIAALRKRLGETK